jgi:hypothetical protein
MENLFYFLPLGIYIVFLGIFYGHSVLSGNFCIFCPILVLFDLNNLATLQAKRKRLLIWSTAMDVLKVPVETKREKNLPMSSTVI